MDVSFILLVFVGFVAQIIDGSLGMAYGVSANSFLLAIGVPPAIASAKNNPTLSPTARARVPFPCDVSLSGSPEELVEEGNRLGAVVMSLEL